MARRPSIETTCDWCELAEAIEAPASETRRLPTGKGHTAEPDLCVPCAILYDVSAPRLEFVARRIAVMTDLELVGRRIDPAVPPQRVLPARVEKPAPKELAAPEPVREVAVVPEPVAVKSPAAPDEKEVRKQKRTNGDRIDDGQLWVLCMDEEGHSDRSATLYYVPDKDRGSHARSSHRKFPQEVPFQTLDGYEYPLYCTEHERCAKAPGGRGFGFATATSMRIHKQKCVGPNWPKVGQEQLDETQTALPVSFSG